MQPTLIINTEKRTKELGDLFGIFFEDINHAADGGLYAELIQNGSFEFCPLDNENYDSMTAWEVFGEGVVPTIRTASPLFKENPHYLQLELNRHEAGVRNLGYGRGIVLKSGGVYHFSCRIRRHEGLCGSLRISLQDEKGHYLCSESRELSTIKDGWQKLSLTLVPKKDVNAAKMEICFNAEGFADIDTVSLMPEDVFTGKTDGLRRDIAELLAELRPKFMRFPGGCLVPDGVLEADARNSMYRWKNTVGPRESRPARRNNWGYNQSLGIGFYEYFTFCEDIGAEAIPVVSAGNRRDQRVPPEELQEFIDDALDLIAFANEPAESKWGKIRAEMGHPEPFCLKYIAIGNEEVGETFFNLYPAFHKAIRERYPEIKIANSGSPFAAGAEYDRGWNSAREQGSDLVDEHYYQSPEWFLANSDRYDSFDPNGPKVFLGEYASWGSTWYNALAEAAYMTHLEKAPAVALACYAPLLCRREYVNWQPDLIWYDGESAYGTPGYYVQKLFMNHQGSDELEAVTLDMPETARISGPPISGGVYFDGNRGQCELTDIRIENTDSGEALLPGNLTAEGTGYLQLAENISWENYSVSFKVKRISPDPENMRRGAVSMRLLFGRHDDANTLRWDIGGWANHDSVIGEDINGRNSCLNQSLFSVNPGQEYSMRLVVCGRRIEAYIDGRLTNSTQSRLPVIEPFYYAASTNRDSGELIVKLVNLNDSPRFITIRLDGGASRYSGTLYSIGTLPLDAENSIENPNRVSIKEEKTTAGSCFPVKLPAHSLQVYRLSPCRE